MAAASAAAASAAIAEAAPTDASAATDFAFEHKIFKLPGARIVMDETTKLPAFHVQLGDLHVALRIDVLMREFGIPPASKDGELLSIAARGLRYVLEIRPFDTIPREILDGSASWTVEERHVKIARVRVVSQAGAAVTREADANFTVERLLSLTGDLYKRVEVDYAFAEMAELLELGANGKGEVSERIETCARELAYIEALREAAGHLNEIDLKLARLTRVYHKDRGVIEDLQRVRNLMRRPISEFADLFLQIEAQTGESLVLLRNVARQVAFIRSSRDDLHHRLMKWRNFIDAWQDQPIECGRLAETNVRALYQFLARNFAPKVDWR